MPLYYRYMHLHSFSTGKADHKYCWLALNFVEWPFFNRQSFRYTPLKLPVTERHTTALIKPFKASGYALTHLVCKMILFSNQTMMSSLFCTYWLEVMLRVSFLWVKLTRGSPWLNGWLVYQMLQTVFCCWSKFSGDMNCPSALSITKQHLFPPSLALKLMNPVMCSFTNMPRDLIMIQALKHFLFMNVALSFITQSVKVFMLLFLVHSFVINHGMVLKMAKVLSLTSQFIEVNWNFNKLEF